MKIIAVEPIGITTNKAAELKEKFQQLGHDFIVFPDRQEDESILIERLADAEIAIISNIRLTKSVLSHCRKLQMLAVAFTGVDHIDLEFCRANNICVCNASGYATIATSELAIALMLDVYRKISELDKVTRKNGTRGNFLGRQLRGKTVGIIGTGAIGCETAMLLKGMGCNIVAWSRSQKQQLINNGINYLSLDALLSVSDIISLHLPLDNTTHHLISAEKLAICKQEAILINTARGNIVDMHALSVALNTGKLAGAGIDVFDTEPPLDNTHCLLNCPNCVLTPHIAYATREAFEHRIDIVIKNIENWLLGSPSNCCTSTK